jgi:hypothetical protein
VITLVLATAYDRTWALLREAFDGESGILLLRATPDEFNSRADLDAVVLSHWEAHELVGGPSEPHLPDATGKPSPVSESQVLNAHFNPYRPDLIGILPPWVLVEPTFDERYPMLAPGEPMYLITTKILDAAERLNGSAAEPTITRLGYHMDRFQFEAPPPSAADFYRREFQSILRAYYEYRARAERRQP